MPNEMFYDNLPSTAKTLDTAFEQPIETEILLADYDAPVFKIVRTSIQHLITQKYIMQDKLTVEGFLRVNVYYQSDQNNRLNCVSQKIPFQKQLDVPENEVNHIDIQGYCQYANTRPQNPTRIDVRGAYLFCVKVYSLQSNRIVTAMGSGSVCCDEMQMDCFAVSGQNSRRFTIENAVELPGNMDKILRIDTSIPTPIVTVYSDKITVKGDINAQILCSVQDSDELQNLVRTLSYNQIVDMPDIKENNLPYVNISVASMGISQNGEDKTYNAVATVNIDALCFAKQQVMAVGDAFSRLYNCEKAQDTLPVDTNLQCVEKAFSVQFENAVPQGSRLCDVQLEVMPPKSYFEINKTTVKARLAANIILSGGQGDIECSVQSKDIVLDWLENCGRYDEIAVELLPMGYMANAGTLSVNMLARGIVIEKQPVTVVTDFAENIDSPLKDRKEGLILYFGKKGERVFDIAKNHCVSPQIIRRENGLQGDVLDSGDMIFISAFEQ